MRRIPLPELLLLGILAVLLLPGLIIAAHDLIPLPNQLDFTSYYIAAQALGQGLSPYDPAVQAQLASAYGKLELAAYLYPPVIADILRPLAALPLPMAGLVWFGLNVLWVVLAARCITWLVRLPGYGVVGVCLLSILNPAVHHTLELGQVSSLLLVLISGALLALGRQSRGAWSDVLGGLLLALATMIKLFPAVLALPLIVSQRDRALAAYGLGLLGLIGLGVVASGGPDLTIVWATQVLPRYAGGFLTPNNQSLEAAIARLFQPQVLNLIPLAGRPTRMQMAPLLNAPWLGLLLGYGLSGVIGLSSLWLLARRWRQQARQIELAEAAFLLATVLLIQPLVWYHYYTLLLLGYAVALPHALLQRSTRILLLASGILVASQRYWRINAQLGTPLVVSCGTLGVGLLWLAYARLMRTSGAAQAPEDLA